MGFSPGCNVFLSDHDSTSNTVTFINLGLNNPELSQAREGEQMVTLTGPNAPFDGIWFSPDDATIIITRPSGNQSTGDIVTIYDAATNTTQYGGTFQRNDGFSSATLSTDNGRTIVTITSRNGNTLSPVSF